MSVHLKTMHRLKASALAYRQDAAHDLCVWMHMGPIGSSCGQAGRAPSVETTPVGSKSLRLIEKHDQEATAVDLANGIERMLVRPISQNGQPALEGTHGFRPLSKHH